MSKFPLSCLFGFFVEENSSYQLKKNKSPPKKYSFSKAGVVYGHITLNTPNLISKAGVTKISGGKSLTSDRTRYQSPLKRLHTCFWRENSEKIPKNL
jgi:hypothetical protein